LDFRRGPRSRSWVRGCRLGHCRAILPPRPRRAVLTGSIGCRRVGIGQVSSGGERLPTQRRLTIETLHLTVPASLLVRADELI
jgi:hypothetical protein